MPSADAVFLIGKDVQAFQELATNLQKGDRSLGLKPPRSKAGRERAAQLLQQFEQTRKPVEQVLAGLKDLVEAGDAQSHMLADAAALDAPLEAVCTGRKMALQLSSR
jgi:twitching motility protein PilJ